jgi:hypothetical protein
VAKRHRKIVNSKSAGNGKKSSKLEGKKMFKKLPDLKRRLKQGKCQKWEPKNPVKQPTPKMANHPKSAAPKMTPKCHELYINVGRNDLGGW